MRWSDYTKADLKAALYYCWGAMGGTNFKRFVEQCIRRGKEDVRREDEDCLQAQGYLSRYKPKAKG